MDLVPGVVGVAGQDGEGAVDLLGQYDAGKLVRQGHAAKGKEKIGALACGRRPSAGGTDGEHKPLNALIANASDVRSELLGGVLLAAAIQQNGVGGGTTGLTVYPIEECGLGVEDLRVAGGVPGCPCNVVIMQTIASLRLGSGLAGNDSSKNQLHLSSLSAFYKKMEVKWAKLSCCLLQISIDIEAVHRLFIEDTEQLTETFGLQLLGFLLRRFWPVNCSIKEIEAIQKKRRKPLRRFPWFIRPGFFIRFAE
jgi:hypothetical protein